MFFATLCFSLMNVIVKVCANIPAFEIVFFRSLVSFLISFAVIKAQKVKFPGNNPKVLLLRGVFGTTALVMFFYTLQVMPLASALLIHYMAPLFTSFLAMIFLKERLGRWQYVFFGICLAGIYLMKGVDDRIEGFDLLLGVLAALFSGAAYTCIRFLKKSENPNLIILYFPLIALPVTGLILWFTEAWVQPQVLELLGLLSIGILTQVAQYLMTVAYQLEKANRVAIITYSGLVWGAILGYFVFGERFNTDQTIAIGLVVLGMMLNVMYTRQPKVRD